MTTTEFIKHKRRPLTEKLFIELLEHKRTTETAKAVVSEYELGTFVRIADNGSKIDRRTGHIVGINHRYNGSTFYRMVLDDTGDTMIIDGNKLKRI